MLLNGSWSGADDLWLAVPEVVPEIAGAIPEGPDAHPAIRQKSPVAPHTPRSILISMVLVRAISGVCQVGNIGRGQCRTRHQVRIDDAIVLAVYFALHFNHRTVGDLE